MGDIYQEIDNVLQEVAEVVSQGFPDLRSTLDGPLMIACCPIDDEDTVATVNAANQLITVDPRKIVDRQHLAETLVHEIVHLEQLRSGRLAVNVTDGVFVWCGTQFDFEDIDDQDHEDAPWEAEADARTEAVVASLYQARVN